MGYKPFLLLGLVSQSVDACLLVRFGAVSTMACEFNMMSSNLIMTGLSRYFIDILLYWNFDVIYLAAFHTANMVMWFYGRIKTFLGAAHLQLEDHAGLCHQLKISIDGAKAYARKALRTMS